MNGRGDEEILDIARGDTAISRHLRDSLKLLKNTNTDPEFGKLVDDVLAGRRSLRDVAFTPQFEPVLNTGVQQFAERYEQLSEEEREELAASGERQLRGDEGGSGHEDRRHDDHDNGDDDGYEWQNFLREESP